MLNYFNSDPYGNLNKKESVNDGTPQPAVVEKPKTKQRLILTNVQEPKIKVLN